MGDPSASPNLQSIFDNARQQAAEAGTSTESMMPPPTATEIGFTSPATWGLAPSPPATGVAAMHLLHRRRMDLPPSQAAEGIGTPRPSDESAEKQAGPETAPSKSAHPRHEQMEKIKVPG